MRPIDPKKRNILYQPGVETYIATNQYLHERLFWKETMFFKFLFLLPLIILFNYVNLSFSSNNGLDLKKSPKIDFTIHNALAGIMVGV